MEPQVVTQDAVPGSSPAPVPATPMPWVQIAWYGALLIILFAPVLATMIKEWATDESMGHGFFVPLVAGYIVWQQHEKILATPVRPHWFGYVLIFLGFVSLVVGILGAEFSVQRAGFMFTLWGILIATCGWPMMKALAFPLVLLLFMIRIPLFIYSQITFPLQLFASRVAELNLQWLGIPVLREGNVLELASQKLNVVEACSGIRSLLSLTFLSLVYGYLFETKLWLRVVLFLATIPIAIMGNATRVTLTGIFSEINPDLAKGIYHTFEGWVIFVVALVGLIATHHILRFAHAAITSPGAEQPAS